MLKALSDTHSGIPQLLGAGMAASATGSVEKVLVDSYTWVDVIWAMGGAMGGAGALLGSMVALYKAWAERKEREERKLRETQ